MANATVTKIPGIPIVVIHQVVPCLWELRPNPDHPTEVGDSDSPALCFVASDIQRPFVTWRKGIKLPAPPPPREYYDALKIRERFMELRTEEQFLEFLRKVGRFSPMTEADKRYGWRLKELTGCQEMFRELAQRSPDTWSDYAEGLIAPRSPVSYGIVAAVTNVGGHKIEFRWNSTPLREWGGTKNGAYIETTDVVSSILTTIELDHVRGAKFGACARSDCPRFFEITSRHKRKYCTQYCAHLEAQRRVRKKQKRAAVKSRRSRPRRS